MNKHDNPYEVLELTINATEAEIKKAYRQLARKYHPDKQKTDEDRQTATHQFAIISDAYDLLNDPVRRYDWRMKHESSQPRSSTTSTSTKTATQSASSTAKKTGSDSSTTPPSATKTYPTVPPTRSTRSSFATGPSPNMGQRPRSAGPGGARRATTGGMAARRGSVGSNMSAAAAAAAATAKRVSSPGPGVNRVSSPGPGQAHRRSAAGNIPRRSMAGPSPIRTQSPHSVTGRKKNSGTSSTRKPRKRASVSADASVGGMRRPSSSPNIAGLSRSMHSTMSGRRIPKKPMGGLEFRSDHGIRRAPPRTSIDAASVASAASTARTMRRPSSRESLNSINTTQTRTMRRPSSRESLNSVSAMKSCKSEPGLRTKMRKSILGVNIRGSTANMRNATFDSPGDLSSKSTKNSVKSALSRKILKMKPLESRA